jgi:Caulimovirus viroplasmin
MVRRLQRKEAWGISHMVSTFYPSFLLQRYLIIGLRNFAATQMKGVSKATFKKFPSKADAEAAYRQAVEDGYVEDL